MIPETLIISGIALILAGIFHRRFPAMKAWKRMNDENAFVMFFMIFPATMFLVVSIAGRIVGGW